ncbi:MAG: glycosyltransferase [Bacteroidetes bacterium]|nr:glycosyltransferase [Bacteroidota bacterium]
MVNKTACICFLGNPNFDTRVNNLAGSFESIGIKTDVIGFEWRDQEVNAQRGRRTIYKLDKSKSSLFYYAKFKTLLILHLLKTNADYYFAEDVYTLPFVTIIAKIKKAKVIYNSRELYTQLAGLRNKSFVQKVISTLEKMYIRKVDLVLTTGEMDTDFIKEKYTLENVLTIRNLPLKKLPINIINYNRLFNLDKKYKVLFYQGVLFEGRGIDQVIKLLPELGDYIFVLCGTGEHKDQFVELAFELGVSDRVFFLGAIDQAELINYTAGADIGFSLIENISISYYYALPNKLFEYIMASVPVIVSDLPQMKKIVMDYKVGAVVDFDNVNELKETILRLTETSDSIKAFKENCVVAAEELNWQKEFTKLLERLNQIG